MQTRKQASTLVRTVVDEDGVPTQFRAGRGRKPEAGVEYRIVLDTDAVGSAPDRNRALDVAGLECVRRDRNVCDQSPGREVGAVQPDHRDRVTDPAGTSTAAAQIGVTDEEVAPQRNLTRHPDSGAALRRIEGDPAL